MYTIMYIINFETFSTHYLSTYKRGGGKVRRDSWNHINNTMKAWLLITHRVCTYKTRSKIEST